MPTQYPDLFAALAAPFDGFEVKQRSQAGRSFQYITARTAMNRLDSVLGPENWWDEYIPGEHSVLCRLTLRLPDGQLLTKSDAGGYAGMSDEGDDDKSGFSDGFKRAAVKFGIARYLYRDGVPAFAAHTHGEVIEPRPNPVNTPESPRQPPQGQRPQSRGHSNGGEHHGPPRSGKALFAWTKEQEQNRGVALLKYINAWAKHQEFPGRMVDWDAEQVRLAHEEAIRKLATLSPPDRGDAFEEALAN